jgi:hypothetical protein
MIRFRLRSHRVNPRYTRIRKSLRLNLDVAFNIYLNVVSRGDMFVGYGYCNYTGGID